MLPNKEPHAGGEGYHSAEDVRKGVRQSETAVGDDDEGGADHCHKQCGYQRDDIRFFVDSQINGYRPECYHCQKLVGPSEIAPDGLKAVGVGEGVNQDGSGQQEYGQCHEETFPDGFLVDFEDIGHYQTCGTQCGVARGDGSGDNAKHCNHGQHGGEPFVGDDTHHGVAAFPAQRSALSWKK